MEKYEYYDKTPYEKFSIQQKDLLIIETISDAIIDHQDVYNIEAGIQTFIILQSRVPFKSFKVELINGNYVMRPYITSANSKLPDELGDCFVHCTFKRSHIYDHQYNFWELIVSGYDITGKLVCYSTPIKVKMISKNTLFILREKLKNNHDMPKTLIINSPINPVVNVEDMDNSNKDSLIDLYKSSVPEVKLYYDIKWIKDAIKQKYGIDISIKIIDDGNDKK